MRSAVRICLAAPKKHLKSSDFGCFSLQKCTFGCGSKCGSTAWPTFWGSIIKVGVRRWAWPLHHIKKRRMRCGVSCGERACRPIRPHELIKRTLFSFHLFFLNAVCWRLGWQGSGRHIKVLSLKSSKLVVNSAWNPACMLVNQGFFEIINHFLQKSQHSCGMYQKSADFHKKRNSVIFDRA